MRPWDLETGAELRRMEGHTAGIQVLTVQNDSPAAAAGLVPQDIIDAVDGQPVPSILDLQGVLRLRRPGVPVELDVVRNGGHWPMHATLGSAAA